MPVYDYKCEQHGLFFELATIDQASAPCACPKCGKSSPRIVLIPPEVLDMSPSRRQAIAANEQARHEPIISSVGSRDEAQARKEYNARKQQGSAGKSAGKVGCGCGSHTHQHETHPDRSSLKQQVVYLPDGSKVFPSQRPWMISH